MKMINKKTGEAVYFNPIRKNGKDAWIIQGIGSTVVIGRDLCSVSPGRGLPEAPRL